MKLQLPLTLPTNDFVAIDVNGQEVAVGEAPHIVVHDRSTGLMWLVAYVGERELPLADGIAQARALDVLGYKDWDVPTRPELLTVVDLTKFNPCIDTRFFPGTHPGWHWSSSPDASAPGDYAWLVYFDYGDCHLYRQDNPGWVRAVRRVGAALPSGQ